MSSSNQTTLPTLIPPGGWIPMSVSDWSGLEWFAVVFGAVVWTFDICAMTWLHFRRKFSYIKIAQVPLLQLMLSGMVIYWFADLSAKRILPQTGAFLICDFWGIWLAWPFGIVLTWIGLTVRLYRLYFILVAKKAAKGWLFYSGAVAMWFPGVAIAIASTIIKGNGPVYGSDVPEICFLATSIQYAFVVHLLLIALIFLFFTVRVHQKRNRVTNEYWPTIGAFITFVVAVIIVLSIIQADLQFTPWGRAICSLVVLFGCNIALWLVIGKIVFNSIFRHEAALAEFSEALKNHNVLGSSSPSTPTGMFGRIVNKLKISSSSALGSGSAANTNNNFSLTNPEEVITQLQSGAGGRSRSFKDQVDPNIDEERSAHLSFHEQDIEFTPDRLPPAAAAMLV